MKKFNALTSSFSIFGLAILMSSNALCEQKDIQDTEGQIVCVENAEEGNIKIDHQVDDCKGVFMLMGNDGKTYTLIGSVEDLKKYKSTEKNNYKIGGQIKGHQRAWILDSTKSDKEKRSKAEIRDIEGDIFCLLPYYKTSSIKKSTLKPILASYPCNEFEPHSHVIRSKDGEIYSVVGSEEKITTIEKNPKDNVLLKGKVRANENGLLLYVF